MTRLIKNVNNGGAWVAQLVGCPTLNFGSSPDLMGVRSLSSALGFTQLHNLLEILSPAILSLSPSPLLSPYNKYIKSFLKCTSLFRKTHRSQNITCLITKRIPQMIISLIRVLRIQVGTSHLRVRKHFWRI